MNLKCSFELVQWSPSVTRLGLVASPLGAVRQRIRLSVSPDCEAQQGQQTAVDDINTMPFTTLLSAQVAEW